jgi:hypothetical protein
MGAGGADQGPVPIRDDIEIEPFDECRIPCGPVSRFILIVVGHGFPRKNGYGSGIIIIFWHMSRKIITMG